MEIKVGALGFPILGIIGNYLGIGMEIKFPE
jgi:hypothetical protein